MSRPFRLAVGFLLATPLCWAERTTEVTLVVDMTPEGRKAVHPDPDHPAYYLPAMSDFMELGGALAHQEPPPPEGDIAHWVAVALSHQGYLVAHPRLRFNHKRELVFADGTVITVPPYPRLNRPIVPNRSGGDPLTVDMIESKAGPYSYHLPSRLGSDRLYSPLAQVLRTVDPDHGPVMEGLPTLAILIRWGAVYPGEVDTDPGNMPPIRMNLGTMVSLMAGEAFDKLSSWDRDDIMQRTAVDRYFITIAAYDFERLLKEHKKVMLWHAKMTVPSNMNARLAEMLPLMIRVGESRLGRESGPQFTVTPLREGRVIVGTPEVKEDSDSPSKSP